MPKKPPAKKTKQKPRFAWKSVSPWAWVYLASLPIAIAWLLHPALDWGTNGDDGWVHYTWGLKPWTEVLGNFFVPKDNKVFLFGTDRPALFLYFKVLRELDIGSYAQAWIAWITSWVSYLGFAWGLVTLARVAFPVSSSAIWALAAMTWWVPSHLITFATVFPDCWLLQGPIGVFWGLLFSQLDRLPEKLRPIQVRAPLAIVAGFIACQTQEAAFVLFGWSSLWLGAVWLFKRSVSFAWAAAPGAYALLHALVYRSMSPGAANRSEFVISFAPASMLHVAKYYLLVGLNGLNDQLLSILGLNWQKVGVAPMPHPVAFVATVAGLGLVVWKTERARSGALDRRLTWLFVAGGLLCTAPYFAIADRQLIYYGMRLNVFLAAFVAIRMGMTTAAKAPKREPGFGLKEAGAVAFLLGAVIAGSSAVSGYNWLKQFGGYAKDLHARVLAHPEAKDCTGASPCCVDLPDRGWNNNEWVLSWLSGAPKDPPFVWPGAGIDCAKTLRWQ